MEKIIEQAMLYDFYGALLNPHQKEVFEEYVLNNLSLSEIAEEQGTSRQAVHDLIKRTDRVLNEYESRLHLVAKFNSIRSDVAKIHSLSGKLSSEKDKELAKEIVKLSDAILDEL